MPVQVHPAREPIPTWVSARWRELWHTNNTLAPCQAAPFAAPPEAHTFPDSHWLYLSVPDSGRSGTRAFHAAAAVRGSALQSWLGSAAIALLSPCSPWPAQWEGEELRAAVPSQVRLGNQPPTSFQKLSLWSWARDTHSDARCDGGQGFQGDL